MRFTIGLIVMTLACAACADDYEHVYDDRADGTTISVVAGEVVTVELEANPSTGYSWVLPEIEGVALVGERFEAESDLAGASRRSIFEFRIEGEGRFVLKLEYRRPWLPDEAPDDTFLLTIESA